MPKKEFISDETINLAGFSKLDPFEQEQVRKVIANFVERIKELSDYRRLKLHLKSIHDKKVKLHKHFVDAELETRKLVLGAHATHRNPYTAVAEVLDKLLEELSHQNKKEIWKIERHKAVRKSKG